MNLSTNLFIIRNDTTPELQVKIYQDLNFQLKKKTEKQTTTKKNNSLLKVMQKSGLTWLY